MSDVVKAIIGTASLVLALVGLLWATATWKSDVDHHVVESERTNTRQDKTLDRATRSLDRLRALAEKDAEEEP